MSIVIELNGKSPYIQPPLSVKFFFTALIKSEDRQFAEKLNITKFFGINGWLEGFKRSNSLAFKKICGESKTMDDDVCKQWIAHLPSLLSCYSQNDIHNADETALTRELFIGWTKGFI